MKSIMSVQFTRKRKRTTDYRKRLKLILSGKTRLVVRKTSSQVIVQLTNFKESGDAVVATKESSKLKKLGWALGAKSIPASYLTGLLAGKLASAKGVKEAVFDAGTTKPESKGRVYAALKGAIDAGISIKASEEIFPGEDRLSGKHINDKAAAMFKEVKAKIIGGKNE